MTRGPIDLECATEIQPRVMCDKPGTVVHEITGGMILITCQEHSIADGQSLSVNPDDWKVIHGTVT